mmetsp:Transcript_17358/g.44092  ORF Transcript_17358/g.44092 Transcript_17358/m.44092 type:complete len:660 (-) Transcript_17358:2545-4524(-)
MARAPGAGGGGLMRWGCGAEVSRAVAQGRRSRRRRQAVRTVSEDCVLLLGCAGRRCAPLALPELSLALKEEHAGLDAPREALRLHGLPCPDDADALVVEDEPLEEVRAHHKRLVVRAVVAHHRPQSVHVLLLGQPSVDLAEVNHVVHRRQRRLNVLRGSALRGPRQLQREHPGRAAQVLAHVVHAAAAALVGVARKLVVLQHRADEVARRRAWLRGVLQAQRHRRHRLPMLHVVGLARLLVALAARHDLVHLQPKHLIHERQAAPGLGAALALPERLLVRVVHAAPQDAQHLGRVVHLAQPEDLLPLHRAQRLAELRGRHHALHGRFLLWCCPLGAVAQHVHLVEGLEQVKERLDNRVGVVYQRLARQYALAEVGEVPEALHNDIEEAVVLPDAVHEAHPSGDLRVLAQRQLRQRLRLKLRHVHRATGAAAYVRRRHVLQAGGNGGLHVCLLLLLQALGRILGECCLGWRRLLPAALGRCRVRLRRWRGQRDDLRRRRRQQRQGAITIVRHRGAVRRRWHAVVGQHLLHVARDVRLRAAATVGGRALHGRRRRGRVGLRHHHAVHGVAHGMRLVHVPVRLYRHRLSAHVLHIVVRVAVRVAPGHHVGRHPWHPWHWCDHVGHLVLPHHVRMVHHVRGYRHGLPGVRHAGPHHRDVLATR